MRPNRDLIVGLLAGGAVVAAWSLSGAAAPEDEPGVVRAARFEVVDERGAVVLVIGTNEEGGSISVRNGLGRTVLLASAAPQGGVVALTSAQTGRPSFVAGATKRGGSLQLLNARGSRIVDAMASETGGVINVSSGDGRLSVSVETTTAGAGSIATYGPHGGELVRLMADRSSRAGLVETYDAGGQRLVSLSATVGHHGQVSTFDAAGRPLVVLTATGDDEGQLYTYADGRPQVAIASRPSGPSLRVFNRHGEAVVTLESSETDEGVIGVWDREGSGRTITPKK